MQVVLDSCKSYWRSFTPTRHCMLGGTQWRDLLASGVYSFLHHGAYYHRPSHIRWDLGLTLATVIKPAVLWLDIERLLDLALQSPRTDNEAEAMYVTTGQQRVRTVGREPENDDTFTRWIGWYYSNVRSFIDITVVLTLLGTCQTSQNAPTKGIQWDAPLCTISYGSTTIKRHELFISVKSS